MIRKIFTVVILTLCLMIISIIPVNASDSFKVEITGITNSGNGAISNYSSYTDNSATFVAELFLPGDYITYEIKVKNFGSIDAVLSKIDIERTDNPAIIFDYQGINEGDILKAGEEATFKVMITYNSEVTTQPTNLTSEIKITLDYTQNGESSSGDDAGDDNNSGGVIGGGSGDSFDILGVSVPNTVAYVSLYIIVIGLLLIIIAIIVLKKIVNDKKEMVSEGTPVGGTPLKDISFLKTNNDDIEVLDLEPNTPKKDAEVLDLRPANETTNTAEENKAISNETVEKCTK